MKDFQASSTFGFTPKLFRGDKHKTFYVLEPGKGLEVEEKWKDTEEEKRFILQNTPVVQ